MANEDGDAAAGEGKDCEHPEFSSRSFPAEFGDMPDNCSCHEASSEQGAVYYTRRDNEKNTGAEFQCSYQQPPCGFHAEFREKANGLLVPGKFEVERLPHYGHGRELGDPGDYFEFWGSHED